MHLIFDFDGTITTADTISHLFHVAISHQHHRDDLAPLHEELVRLYLQDYEAYVRDYPTPEAARRTAQEEIAFLARLQPIEEASLTRVGDSGIFAGLGDGFFRSTGAAAARDGDVVVREGFRELVDVAMARGWRVSVISVNWSRSFIQGVLQLGDVEVVANEISPDGRIGGPPGLGKLTTSGAKRRALDVVRGEGEGVMYFGDSVTDLECLLEGGVAISLDGEGKLVRTLEKIGLAVPHVGDVVQGKVCWARDFREVLESGLERQEAPRLP